VAYLALAVYQAFQVLAVYLVLVGYPGLVVYLALAVYQAFQVSAVYLVLAVYLAIVEEAVTLESLVLVVSLAQ
jgi:hypothetical protein